MKLLRFTGDSILCCVEKLVISLCVDSYICNDKYHLAHLIECHLNYAKKCIRGSWLRNFDLARL